MLLPDTWGIRYLLLMCNRLPPNPSNPKQQHDYLMFLWVRNLNWFWIRVPHEVVNQAADWGYHHPGQMII